MSEHLVVFTTLPDAGQAETLAQALVEQNLAACVNILPPVTSVYRWQGELQQDREQLLLIKTRAARYDALMTAIKAQHPYELPEIIALPITAGLPAYLNWIDDTTQ